MYPINKMSEELKDQVVGAEEQVPAPEATEVASVDEATATEEPISK